MKTFQEFIEAHKVIKGDDYSTISINANDNYQVTFQIWSSKFDQNFSAPTAEGVLEAYKNAFDGVVTDIEMPFARESENI